MLVMNYVNFNIDYTEYHGCFGHFEKSRIRSVEYSSVVLYFARNLVEYLFIFV